MRENNLSTKFTPFYLNSWFGNQLTAFMPIRYRRSFCSFVFFYIIISVFWSCCFNWPYMDASRKIHIQIAWEPTDDDGFLLHFDFMLHFNEKIFWLCYVRACECAGFKWIWNFSLCEQNQFINIKKERKFTVSNSNCSSLVIFPIGISMFWCSFVIISKEIIESKRVAYLLLRKKISAKNFMQFAYILNQKESNLCTLAHSVVFKRIICDSYDYIHFISYLVAQLCRSIQSCWFFFLVRSLSTLLCIEWMFVDNICQFESENKCDAWSIEHCEIAFNSIEMRKIFTKFHK